MRTLTAIAAFAFVAAPLLQLTACVGDSANDANRGDASSANPADGAVDGTLPDGAPSPDGGDGGDGGPILTSCDGGLVDLKTDPKNCGTCGKACGYDGGAPNVVAACNAGTCGSGCDVGWGDCNGQGGDGCEAPTTQITQCGACGHVCGSKNASPQCVLVKGAYACKLNCSAGTASCDADDANGCETDLSSDPKNCGACGFDCGTASCVAGMCRLTGGTQDFVFDPSEVDALAIDATNVYFTQANVAPSGVIRKVPKLGGAVVDVRPPSDFGAALGVNRTIAVDKNYVYYLEKSYPRNFLRVPKNGSAAPENLGPLGANSANAVGILLDADANGTATKVFSTEVCNGPGVWAGDIVAKTATNLAFDVGNGCDAAGRGMVMNGKKLYFGLVTLQKIDVIDYAAQTPTVSTFWSSLGCTPNAMATDGGHLYVACNTQLLSFDLPNGNTKTVVVNGNQGLLRVAADGTGIYVLADGLYRFAPSDVNAPLDASHKLAMGPNGVFKSLALDATAVYVQDYKDVYRVHR